MLSNPRFESSYRRLFGDNVTLSPEADHFFREFYRRFLRCDGVAELFANTDLSRQVQMLRKSLFQLVSYYLLSEASPELYRLAEIHRAKKVDKAMFDSWLNALLDTVADLDDEFDEATRLAWCWALAPGITFMKIYACDETPQALAR